MMRPSNRTVSLIVALGSTLALASPASALDCGTRLVTVGDGEAYVRSICGEPEAISTHTESRTDFVAYPSTQGRGVLGSAVTVNVQIDVWVYDFGSTRFMEQLTFANGVLRAMGPLGYGTVGGGRRRRESLERHGSLFGSPELSPRLAPLLAIFVSRRDVLTRA